MYKFKQKLLIIFKENKVVGLTIILSLILIIKNFLYIVIMECFLKIDLIMVQEFYLVVLI